MVRHALTMLDALQPACMVTSLLAGVLRLQHGNGSQSRIHLSARQVKAELEDISRSGTPMMSPMRRDPFCSHVPDQEDSVLERLLIDTVVANLKSPHGGMKDNGRQRPRPSSGATNRRTSVT